MVGGKKCDIGQTRERKLDVNGKKALVFGGTSGIGLATITRLADAGASVVAISRDPSKAGNPGPDITLERCDVRNREELRQL